jgi:hypothetical protein
MAAISKVLIKDNIILSYLLLQKRKKRKRKLDSLINLFLKTNMFNYFLMKRNVIYNILNKENLKEMMIHYFTIRRTYGRRKLFDCTNHPNPGLNLSFDNPIFIQNTSEEIDLNLMKKDVIWNFLPFEYALGRKTVAFDNSPRKTK